MPLWLFPLLFVLDFSLESDEICYPSVFVHSKNSLPSTAPLCLLIKNDRTFSEFTPPVPIQNEDQWNNFVKENHLSVDGENESLSPNLIYRVSSSGEIYPWQLPYSFQSEKCHRLESVEFKMPMTVDCQPIIELTQESCEKNPLSATALAADEFILERMNVSVSLNSTNFQLYSPVWRDGNCLNFVVKARITIFLTKKDVEIESVRLDRLIYGVINNSNVSSTIPEFEIRYAQSEKRKGDIEESGFEEGDFVLFGDSQSVWRLPSGLDCIGQSTVRFKQDFVSSCIIGFSSCAESETRVNSLLSSLPSSILDSPFIDNSTYSVPFVSPKQDKTNTFDSGCILTSGVSIVITHSLSGSVHSPRRLITSVLVSHQFSRLPSIPLNSTNVFIFSLKFLDVTPDPTHTFSTPPRIDLRLPNDFFYPFLFNSAFDSCFISSFIITSIAMHR